MNLLWILSLCSLAAANYCPQCKVFSPPKPLPVQVIYEGGKCECEKSLPYNVDYPKPVRKEYTHYDYSYKVEAPKETDPKGEVRYNFDYKVETPVEKSCNCRMEGLVTQVDRITLPSKECNCQQAEKSFYRPSYVPLLRRTRATDEKAADLSTGQTDANVGDAQDSTKPANRFLKKFPRLQRIQARQQQRHPIKKRSFDDFENVQNFDVSPTKCSVLENIKNGDNLESFQIPEILQYAPEVADPINRERKHCKFCNGGRSNGRDEQCQFCNHNGDSTEIPSQYHEYVGGASVPYSMKKPNYRSSPSFYSQSMPPMPPMYQSYQSVPLQYPPVYQAYQVVQPSVVQQPIPQAHEMQPRYVFDRMGHRYLENNGNLRIQPNGYYNDPPEVQMLSNILAHSLKDIKEVNPSNENQLTDNPKQQAIDAINFIKLISKTHPENVHYMPNYPVKRSFDVIPLTQNDDGSFIVKISPNDTANIPTQATYSNGQFQTPTMTLPMAVAAADKISLPQQVPDQKLIEPGQIIEIIEVDPSNPNLKTNGNFVQTMSNGKKYEVLSSIPHTAAADAKKTSNNEISKEK